MAEALIYSSVRRCIRFDKLGQLERQIFEELAHLPELTDPEMLALARSAIARQLREIAEDFETPVRYVPDDCRYLNAICAEVDPGPRSPTPAPESTPA